MNTYVKIVTLINILGRINLVNIFKKDKYKIGDYLNISVYPSRIIFGVREHIQEVQVCGVYDNFLCVVNGKYKYCVMYDDLKHRHATSI